MTEILGGAITDGIATGTGSDTEDALADLRRAVIGPVYDPGDVEIVTELAGFNLAAHHVPIGVVGATGADDVAAAVAWAAERDVPVAVVATGHADVSHVGSLVVTTRRMDRLVVDPVARTATVGAGVKWARVVEAAAPHGLVGLNGSSSDVGVVGYTLGGGMGTFVRRHGYAVDKVRRMQVVTGDGAVREVTADTDPELFRALLGGKDSVGIVTEMTFELVAEPEIYGGAVFYDGADAASVLHAWREWAPTLPEETTTSVAILRLPDMDTLPPPLRGRTVVHLRVAHLGSPDEGEALVAPMRAVATPVMDALAALPYAAIDAIHMDPPDPMPSWATGTYLHEVDAATIDTLLEAAGPQRDLPLIVAELRHVDGAGTRGTAGCVPRAPFALGLVAPMVPPLRDVVPAVAFGVLDALAPWGTGYDPVNWASPETVSRRPRGSWTDADRERLAAVARRVDPAGVLGARRYGI